MSKVLVILKREYLTRVKNKTFIIMTFAGPLLIALFYAGVFWVATKDSSDNETQKVLYQDNSGFYTQLDSFENYLFVKSSGNAETDKKKIIDGEFQAILNIHDRDLQNIDSIEWISKNTLSLLQSEKVSSWLSDKVYNGRLKTLGISQGAIDSLKPKTSLKMVEIDNSGELKNSSSGMKSGAGFLLAFVVYMFIFVYGSMVMRSALEEKTNRIVEVIVSSVKPFQMMLGKILGVALVGLTQFGAWIVLSILAITGMGIAFGSKANEIATHVSAANIGQNSAISGQLGNASSFTDTLMNLPYLEIVVIFLIFFAGGFLLYSSMFAAIGSAVNQETDVQQFMLPISLPLIFGFVIAQNAVFQDPNGSMAKIFSMIPFTSPIVMVVRAPFGVPWSEILLSAVILFATFFVMVWITGRIYRIGILMYGKKPTWKELGKWIFMKD